MVNLAITVNVFFAGANCFTAESLKKLILSGGVEQSLQPQRNVYYIYNLKQNQSVFARRTFSRITLAVKHYMCAYTLVTVYERLIYKPDGMAVKTACIQQEVRAAEKVMRTPPK